MREWNPSLRLYLEGAKAAVDNADGHASAAQILLDSGHTGPAAALAVIGQEETGKALLLTMIGFALIPEDAIPEAIQKANHHASKQQLALVGHVLAKIGPKIRPYVDQLPDDLEVGEELLRDLLGPLIPVIRNEVNTFITATKEFDERLAKISEDRALQELKHSALYVDLRGGKIVGPSSVTSEVASKALADLRESLEGIRMFTQIAGFTDEGLRLTRSALDSHLEVAEESDLSRQGVRG